MDKQAKVIAGFPGIGKTTFVENTAKRKKVIDLDSFLFRNGDQSVDWSSNYLSAIRQAISKFDVVLISSFPEIIVTLAKEDVEIIVVYPDKSQCLEYERRYRERGSNKKIVEVLVTKFESNVDNLTVLTCCRHIVLKSGQYFSDIAKEII